MLPILRWPLSSTSMVARLMHKLRKWAITIRRIIETRAGAWELWQPTLWLTRDLIWVQMANNRWAATRTKRTRDSNSWGSSRLYSQTGTYLSSARSNSTCRAPSSQIKMIMGKWASISSLNQFSLATMFCKVVTRHSKTNTFQRALSIPKINLQLVMPAILPLWPPQRRN